MRVTEKHLLWKIRIERLAVVGWLTMGVIFGTSATIELHMKNKAKPTPRNFSRCCLCPDVFICLLFFIRFLSGIFKKVNPIPNHIFR
jgi:hypothetical protein